MWHQPSTPDATLQQILQATLHLLHPQTPDGCSTLAGQLLVQLLKSVPGPVASYLPALMHASVRKLQAGGSPQTICGLLLFFCRLALMDVHKFVAELANMNVPQPGECVHVSNSSTQVVHLACYQSITNALRECTSNG